MINYVIICTILELHYPSQWYKCMSTYRLEWRVWVVTPASLYEKAQAVAPLPIRRWSNHVFVAASSTWQCFLALLIKVLYTFFFLFLLQISSQVHHLTVQQATCLHPPWMLQIASVNRVSVSEMRTVLCRFFRCIYLSYFYVSLWLLFQSFTKNMLWCYDSISKLTSCEVFIQKPWSIFHALESQCQNPIMRFCPYSKTASSACRMKKKMFSKLPSQKVGSFSVISGCWKSVCHSCGRSNNCAIETSHFCGASLPGRAAWGCRLFLLAYQSRADSIQSLHFNRGSSTASSLPSLFKEIRRRLLQLQKK